MSAIDDGKVEALKAQAKADLEAFTSEFGEKGAKVAGIIAVCMTLSNTIGNTLLTTGGLNGIIADKMMDLGLRQIVRDACVLGGVSPEEGKKMIERLADILAKIEQRAQAVHDAGGQPDAVTQALLERGGSTLQ